MKVHLTTLFLLLEIASAQMILRPTDFKHYVKDFNKSFAEDVINAIPDAASWEWMEHNVPLFSCPDPDVELTWYYRWWTFRKHIKKTSEGYVLTEFLKPVRHAGKHNTISCALGHHIAEGRWLRDRRYIDEYVNFWLRGGENGAMQPHYHQYSNWTAWALYDRWLADKDTAYLATLLDALIADYRKWEDDRLLPNGLFWQYDVRDGMEESASGSRRNKNARPTINSYMYGNAKAVAAIAKLAAKPDVAQEYETRAGRIQSLVESKLWDKDARSFKSLLDTGNVATVREEIGFTPWFFLLPAKSHGYEAAWRQLMDPQGFFAPYGPTTAERRHPAYGIREQGDNCQWNGPSWPFSTAITLKALANVLQEYPSQSFISTLDYWKTFFTYTKSQRLRREDGRIVPFVDENLNPDTGEWWARALQIKKGTHFGRGDHYNHSSYNDLIITGVVGLRPRADDIVEVKPLFPSNTWDWFCLDSLPYHGYQLTILWDRAGTRFGKGNGLHIYADGRQIAHGSELRTLTGRLR